jgi:hypothetical protein
VLVHQAAAALIEQAVALVERTSAINRPANLVQAHALVRWSVPNRGETMVAGAF